MTDQLNIHAHQNVGHISLNRPKAIHALTLAMCRAMSDVLADWAENVLIAPAYARQSQYWASVLSLPVIPDFAEWDMNVVQCHPGEPPLKCKFALPRVQDNAWPQAAFDLETSVFAPRRHSSPSRRRSPRSSPRCALFVPQREAATTCMPCP